MVIDRETNLGVLSVMKERLMEKLVYDADTMKVLTDQADINLPAKDEIYNTIYPWKKKPSTVLENKTFVTFEIEIPRTINCAANEYVLRVYVMVHDSNMIFDKAVATKLGLPDRGTRMDVLADKINYFLNGSTELGFTKIELQAAPTFEPSDGYHGRMLEYQVLGWNRWGEKL